jgi:NADH-quinone oxidoreductase subunit N
VSAPVLWIIVPILIGSFILLLSDERTIAVSGGVACLALAGLALSLPIDEALLLGPISLKVASSASFLGRSLVIPPAEAPLLAVVFGLCAIWFFGSEAAGVAGRLVPLGMIITGLLVASIAVQPFLYAALLIELAALAAIPLLSPPSQRPGRGVMRFLIYQTLGMPFILFSGWLLTGVEASPGDLSLTVQSTVMLGLGFAFLLAIFPLSDWIPRVIEESSPYAAGFILWLLPNLVAVFAMGFLDRYAWLRTSAQVVLGLRAMGLVMVMVGSLWSIVERQLGRLMGFAVIAETGFLLLAISQAAANNTPIVFWFFIPRGLALAVWALALSVLRASGARMDLSGVRGLARRYPWASGGLVLAALAVGGLPLLAGFPPRLGLWAGLADSSLITAGWFLVGLFGLMIGAIRQLGALIVPDDAPAWTSAETLAQRGMLGFGALVLLLLGIFPQSLDFVLGRLPSMFEHLAR